MGRQLPKLTSSLDFFLFIAEFCLDVINEKSMEVASFVV